MVGAPCPRRELGFASFNEMIIRIVSAGYSMCAGGSAIWVPRRLSTRALHLGEHEFVPAFVSVANTLVLRNLIPRTLHVTATSAPGC